MSQICKMTHGKWQGNPSALVRFDDGRVYGFVHKPEDGTWHKGGDAAGGAFSGLPLSDADLEELGALPPHSGARAAPE